MPSNSDGFRVGYVPAVATLEDRLVGRVSEPGRVVVQHVTGWRITWPEGARLADITDPAGVCVDAVQVTEWDWNPPEGGASRMTGEPPGTEDLARALAEYVAEHHGALDLPGLE